MWNNVTRTHVKIEVTRIVFRNGRVVIIFSTGFNESIARFQPVYLRVDDNSLIKFTQKVTLCARADVRVWKYTATFLEAYIKLL